MPAAGDDAGGGVHEGQGDAESVVRAIVLRQLTMAPRSRAQLVTALAKRDAPPEVAERVLDRFEEVGLVDDQAFARGWVRSRHTARGLSRRAIAGELRTRGIDDEVAAEALADVGDEDERRAAEALVARRLRTVRGLPREKAVHRLVAMLARKGYSGGLALTVVRQALAELPDEGLGETREEHGPGS